MLPAEAFNVWSTVLVVLLVVLWLFNITASITGALNGKVFGLHRGWQARYADETASKES